MEKLPDLKPCPFCGGSAGVGVQNTYADSYHWVACACCGIRTAHYSTLDKACSKWNKRVKDYNIIELLKHAKISL